jgi:hypothetical protein
VPGGYPAKVGDAVVAPLLRVVESVQPLLPEMVQFTVPVGITEPAALSLTLAVQFVVCVPSETGFGEQDTATEGVPIATRAKFVLALAGVLLRSPL